MATFVIQEYFVNDTANEIEIWDDYGCNDTVTTPSAL
jgi:hypothetical protein